MAKRNVTNTSSVEVPVRKSIRGIPDNINVAAIEDFKTNIFTTSGNYKEGQDAHDGSSMLEYVYSKMLDESFPGKGYSGTKKQFGTLVTDYGATIKKDAESVITNDKIRNSKNSVIPLITKKKQMLNIPIGNLELKFNSGDLDNYYMYKNGENIKVTSIKIINKDGINKISISYAVGRKNQDGNYEYFKAEKPIYEEFNTLYKL
ncbi:MAG: hypothetical protein PHX40_01890 [Bacilli bacterium]|nr:hypothetical protein [Bacilli bacterium]